MMIMMVDDGNEDHEVGNRHCVRVLICSDNDNPEMMMMVKMMAMIMLE